MRFDGNTVLVTGGASGLGGATTEAIVQNGGNAVILDVNEAAGNALASKLGNKARFVKTDVTSDADVQRAVDTAVQAFGAVHGAVNAAGIGVAERVVGKEGPQPLANFTKVIQINLIGTFNVIRLAAAAMAKNEPNEAVSSTSTPASRNAPCMARITSGRVTTSSSLQPSNWGPPKSSGPRSWVCT